MAQIRQDTAQLIITVDAKESAEFQKTLTASAKAVVDIKKLTAGTDEYNKALNDQVAISKKLANADYSKLSLKQLQDRRTQLVQLQRTIPGVTFAESGLEKELRQVNQAMSDNAKRTRAVSTAMDEGGSKLGKFSSAFKAVFATVVGFNFLQIIKAGFSSFIGSSIEFEAAMSNVKAVSNATAEDTALLSARAKELGETTSKTAIEAAEGLKYLALAGYSTQEQLVALEPVLRLSEAGGIDLALASDLATDALSAMGLKANDLNGFLDKTANTSTISNTSIQQLNEGFIRAGGILRTLNVPLDEANALFAILANRGEKGSEAGTGLNSVLINLTTGAGQAGDAMKDLNLSAFDSNGNFKGVSVVLKELNGKLAGMTQEQQNAYKAMIGGKVNVGTFSALLSGLGEEFDSLKDKISDSEGKLNDVATTMLDNTKGSWTLFKSAIEGTAIAIGETLLPMINSLIKGGIVFINTLRAIPQFIRENEVAIKAMVLGLVIFNGQMILAAANSLRLAAVERGRAIVTGAVTTAQSLLNAAMTANPIGLVIKAVGLLVAGFGILYSKSETVRAGIAGLGNVAAEIFTIVKESVGAFINGFKQLKDGNFSEAFASFGEAINKSNPVGIALLEGKRLKDAFNKGYNDKLEAEKAKKEAEKQAKDLVDSVDKITASANKPTAPATSTTTDSKKTKSKKDSTTKSKNEVGIFDFDQYDPKIVKVALDLRLKMLAEAAKKEESILKESYLSNKINEDQYNLDTLRAKSANLETQIALLDNFGHRESDQRRALNIELLENDKKLFGERLQQIIDSQPEELGVVRMNFIKRLITEEEYTLRSLRIQIAHKTQSLQMLKDEGYEKTQQFINLQEELMKLKEEYNVKSVALDFSNRVDELDTYQQALDFYMQAQIDFDEGRISQAELTEARLKAIRLGAQENFSNTIDFAIDLLGKDEKARKKHASAIKAFEIAKIGVNLQTEISAIWKNANLNPVNGIVPGWAQIFAGVQTALAVGRSAVAVGRVKAQQFYQSGKVQPVNLTGSQRINYDANIPTQSGGDNILGIVKKDEVILNKNHQNALGGDATFAAIGVPGFANGGLVLPSTQPIGLRNVNISAPAPQSDPRIEMLARSVSNMAAALPQALSNINATINYNHLTTESSKINDIKRIASY